MTRALHDDIEAGKSPSWDVYGQIISPDVAEGYPIDIFDPTKTLPSKDFPYRPFGRIVLNKNVGDNFAETEQAAFSPANVVPGWALSPDPGKYRQWKKNVYNSMHGADSFDSPPAPGLCVPGCPALPPRRQLHPAAR